MLQNQTKTLTQEKRLDVGLAIEDFEDQFRNLHKKILCQLVASAIDTLTVINSLTLLPMKLKKEYQKAINESLPSFVQKKTIRELFFHLNHLFSFIDYGLLEYIIKLFGSDLLKQDMKTYCNDVQLFMKQTTIKELIDCLPGQTETPPNFDVLKAKIGEDASKCTLERINILRKRFCAEVKLSEVIFCLIALEDSNSFIISWLVPSILVPDLIESAREIKESFFNTESIMSLSVGNQWLYNTKLSPFGAQLKIQYQQSQGSPSPVEWIPSPTKKIFRLAMIQRERVQSGHIEDRFVQMTISGKVDDILRAKSPVELEHIFTSILYGNDIILIEGAPGSGKSTLTVHICQRWGKGELFQQFTVVILVQLRDPAVQRAQTIADLLPVEDPQELAAELMATNGRGVLWVLDGWDELPSHLQQDSIFRKLLPPKPNKEKLKEIKKDPFYAKFVARGYSKEELWVMYLQNNPQVCIEYYNKRLLNKCSVIVTSRPISSGDLHPVVSSRIEVLGFTPEEQRQYFTECLKGDTKALEALLEKIQENPVVQSVCYLPLNAAFIMHTFKYNRQSLPNTEYEIYLSVILSCIQRHFEREGRGHDLPKELAASLDDLSRSEVVRKPFQCLCELAYRGVMKNKVTFSSSDLPQGSNTLSLLQAVESFLQSGKSVFYNFLHLSIQEVLSAYYIATWLSDSEQVSRFQQLFNQPRFAAVFQFYSAITKLKSPGIHQVINSIVKNESKPLLLSLLRCLYEAQDPSLCLYVAERLKYELDFSETSLSPLECLSISFFLSSITVNEVSINLCKCYISDIGAKYFTKYLGSDVDHINKVAVYLHRSEINEVSVLRITRMLHFIEHLHLSDNPIGDIGVALISKAVRETVTLRTLILSRCGINLTGAKYLSRALAQNTPLEKLDIGGNNLGDEGISHVAEALKQNTQLKELWIGDCGMTNKGAVSLASALGVNNSLKILQMGEDKGALTEYGLLIIAQSFTDKSMFETLVISYQFDIDAVFKLRRKVNEARKKNGLSSIHILGEYKPHGVLPTIEIEGELYTYMDYIGVSYQFMWYFDYLHICHSKFIKHVFVWTLRWFNQ